MKKLYIILITILPVVSVAQPTITQADLPFSGLAFTLASDSNYTGAILPGGAAQTWNYASLLNNYPDTNGFIDAAGTPFAADFPTSNLASFNATTGQWTYFSTNSTGFYVDGFDTSNVSFRLTPGQLFAPVPFTFGDTRTNTAHIEVDTVVLTFNAKIIFDITSSFEADGYGTLILPNNTYSNVLRYKITEVTVDSQLVDFTMSGNYTYFGGGTTQKTLYRWSEHGGTENYLLGIDADSLGTTATKSAYLLQYAVLSVPDISSKVNSVNLFPNPAVDVVHFNFSSLKNDNAILCIFNSVGEEVKTFSINNEAMFEMEVASFNNEVYFYSISSPKEKLNGKFIVMH